MWFSKKSPIQMQVHFDIWNTNRDRNSWRVVHDTNCEHNRTMKDDSDTSMDALTQSDVFLAQ